MKLHKILLFISLLFHGGCSRSNKDQTSNEVVEQNARSLPANLEKFPFDESLLRDGGTRRIVSTVANIPTFYICFPEATKGIIPVYTESEWTKGRSSRTSLEKEQISELFAKVRSEIVKNIGVDVVDEITNDRDKLNNLTEEEVFEYDENEELRNRLEVHFILSALEKVEKTSALGVDGKWGQ